MTEFEILALVELRAIRELIEARRVPRDDRHVALLVAIARAAGGRTFSIRELLAHALVDPELRAAIGGQSGRQLGRLLRRIEGRELGGLVVACVGEDNSGLLWSTRETSKTTLRIA